ncbi:MAG: hypothetical protein K9K76_07900 [Halanaerobiales bacterium]|nr:hypothetical protein [Halanaerobiales bacterium]
MTSKYLKSPFNINLDNLETVPYLIKMIERAVEELNGSDYYCELDVNCEHNFGNYASGYRVFLKNKQEDISLYVYTGIIYSYKKDPAGLFTEVDRNNNKKYFNQIDENIKSNSYYTISQKEDGFLKLFNSDYERYIKSDNEVQYNQLIKFINHCFKAFLKPLDTLG